MIDMGRQIMREIAMVSIEAARADPQETLRRLQALTEIASRMTTPALERLAAHLAAGARRPTAARAGASRRGRASQAR
ncbi:MAG: hypothetical protein OHK0024_21270 [Thalassobaculales bacterium]